MIVCHCEVVSDRAVAAAYESGARTLAEVCKGTGEELRRLRLLAEATAVPA